MKRSNRPSRSILIALVAGGALLGASSTFAQDAPDRTPAAYPQAHLVPVDLNVSIGWHGDRYWDGHRYWEHDEWMHHHPHDRDPRRFHEHGRDFDHRPPPDNRY
ncbi:hypothetical protein [Trinickia sp.]|uniref:hypothetical protein n=1 Tax=Trinickia sp. TaxID=2571163 RepID=UPI003F80B284